MKTNYLARCFNVLYRKANSLKILISHFSQCLEHIMPISNTMDKINDA